VSGAAIGADFSKFAAAPAEAVCAHCGLPAAAGLRFCCPGCAAAFETIQGLGLGAYYAQRVLDRAARPLRPDASERWDLARCITTDASGR
jgi:Cu2+-exporting ATPase